MARGFQRNGSPALADKGTFPNGYRARTQHDFAQAAGGAVIGRPLEIDLMGDGNVVPVFLVDSGTPRYVAARVEAGTVKTLATYNVPDGISILTNQVYTNPNRPYPQLVLARNDGYLTLLDNGFMPTNGGTFGPPEFPEYLPGMRVGGFIVAPNAPRLSGNADAVIATNSRGASVNLDASSAWMLASPKVAWERASAWSPTTAPTIDNGEVHCHYARSRTNWRGRPGRRRVALHQHELAAIHDVRVRQTRDDSMGYSTTPGRNRQP